MTAEDKELGALIARYETDNGRRGRTALILLLIGVLLLGLPAVGLFLQSSAGPQVYIVPGPIAGIGFVFLWTGISHGRGYLARGDEAFEVREGGLVHAYSGRTHVVAWNEIVAAYNRRAIAQGDRDYNRDSGLLRFLGRDENCIVLLRGGSRMRITGFTKDARRLVQTLERVVNRGTRPREDSRGTLRGLAAVFVVLGAAGTSLAAVAGNGALWAAVAILDLFAAAFVYLYVSARRST